MHEFLHDSEPLVYMRNHVHQSLPFESKWKECRVKSKQSAYNLLEEFWFLNKRKKHSGFDFDFCCRQLIFGRLETIDATVNKLLGIMPPWLSQHFYKKVVERLQMSLVAVHRAYYAFCLLRLIYSVSRQLDLSNFDSIFFIWAFVLSKHYT